MAKILIADDSRVMRQIITRTLREAGFVGHDVVEAADGSQALEIARSQAPFALILTDWDMPGLTGQQFVEQLTERPPVVFVLSECSDERKTQIENMGAELIVKTFTAYVFNDKLSPYLS